MREVHTKKLLSLVVYIGLACSLFAVPLDGALKLKLGSSKQDCIAVLSQNANVSQDYDKASEIRYGGIFDTYYNSVITLYFSNAQLSKIRIEIIQDDQQYAFNEIMNNVISKYQISPEVDTSAFQALWTFDNSRYIKLYKEGILLVLEYTDENLLAQKEGDSSY
jgi:hypothetical protein